jgi:hypothetical protein
MAEKSVVGAKKKLTADDLIAQAALRKEAKKDPKKHSHQAPLGYHLRGVSTLLDRDGNVAQTWVKTQKSMEDPQAILDAFQLAVAEREIKVAPKVKAPTQVNSDLLTVIPIGDSHINMLAWAEETGEDFDMHIAERNLLAAMDHMLSLAPPSEEALIINLGDYFHADNNLARTERSGAPLDTDSRYAKVLRVGVSILVRCVDRALEKHKKVTVISEIGNHDPNTSIMLGVCLQHHYHNNPRVHIDISPNKFHWYHFGRNLIGTTHGDTIKADKLPGVMACDKKELWGTTDYRHFYVGHVHHQRVIDLPGVTVEFCRTLAAKDAWHSASGYRSPRSLVCDIWHRTRGRILRHEIGVESL